MEIKNEGKISSMSSKLCSWTIVCKKIIDRYIDMKGQEKEILIEEIMGLLSSSTGYDHHTENDSLRFSTDYDPINLTNDD